jgi:hypothetical protein
MMKSITCSHFFSKLATLAILTTACSCISAVDSSNLENAASYGIKNKENCSLLTSFEQSGMNFVAKKHEDKHITLYLQNFMMPGSEPASFSFRIGLAKPDGKITWGKPIIMNDLPTTPWKICRVYKPENGVYSIVVQLLKVDSPGSLTMTTQATNSKDEHKYLNTFTLEAESQYVHQRFVLGTFVFQ